MGVGAANLRLYCFFLTSRERHKNNTGKRCLYYIANARSAAAPAAPVIAGITDVKAPLSWYALSTA